MNPPPPPAARRPRLGGVLFALGGLALFVYFVERAGIGDVAEGIRRIGWGFLLILGLSGLRFAVRAAAWIGCMPAGHGLTLRHVVPAALAGDALGNLLNVVVGEPAKALYLRHRAPLGRTLPALVVENLFYTLSTVVVIGAGGVALVLLVQVPGGGWLATGIPIATLAALLVGAAHWIIWSDRRVVSAGLSWLAGHGIAVRVLARAAALAREAEERLQRDYPREWGRLLVVAALELSFHVLAIVEVALVLGLISDRPVTLMDAFVLEAANRFVNVVFKVVPMRLGVDEAGTAMVADLLAYGTTVGVTMAIVRKSRMLFWAAIGVGAFVRRGLSVADVLSASAREVAIVVMARAPHGARPPKSRLAPTITGDDDRRRLYTAFLRDTLAKARSLDGVSLRVAFTPDGGGDDAETLGITDSELLFQRGDDLGARERGVFIDLFAAGFSQVVMIGSDLPSLPVDHLARAIELLEDRTVAIGPARDGGYYLLGLTAPGDRAVPDLFDGIRWGTGFAFDDTVAAAGRAGLTVALVPPWYDVDDEAGLEALRRDLDDPGREAHAPATAAVIDEIFKGGARRRG